MANNPACMVHLVAGFSYKLMFSCTVKGVTGEPHHKRNPSTPLFLR